MFTGAKFDFTGLKRNQMHMMHQIGFQNQVLLFIGQIHNGLKILWIRNVIVLNLHLGLWLRHRPLHHTHLCLWS